MLGQGRGDGLRSALELVVGSKQHQGLAAGGAAQVDQPGFHGALVPAAVAGFGDVVHQVQQGGGLEVEGRA